MCGLMSEKLDMMWRKVLVNYEYSQLLSMDWAGEANETHQEP
jgi:hypothetical protein